LKSAAPTSTGGDPTCTMGTEARWPNGDPGGIL
jgi:hypothetical protein